MKLTQNELISKITYFNNEMSGRGCKSRIHYDIDTSTKEYKLLIGSEEQFSCGVYQSIICVGSIKECYLALNAVYLAFSFELNMY